MSTALPGLAGRHFWERTVLGWHLAFAAMVAVVVVASLLDAEISNVRRWLTVGLCALMVAWYVGMGAPNLMTTPPVWRVRAYVIGAVLLALAVSWFQPGISWTSFIVIPQAFAMLPRLIEAICAAAVMLAGYGAILLAQSEVTGADRWALVFGLLVSLGFAAAIGIWISGIVRQSTQRAGLIDELDAARAELAALSHDNGVAAERERLSREIHDTLAQGFTSIVMLLEAAEATLDRDPGKAREQLSLARTAARENLAESRSLIAALSPPALREQGLVGALSRLTGRLDDEMASVTTQLTVAGTERPLSSATEVVLLRAAQEALTNVGKHSAARTVAVTLDFDEPSTTLTVCDDGRGFQIDNTENGFGLNVMRSRVADIHGSLSVSSQPGSGTTVRVSVP